MNDGVPFEAKLQEHLQALREAALAAKARVADGIAGLVPHPAAAQPAPAPGGKHRAAVNFDEPTTRVGVPTFDPTESDIADPGSDEEGIPVWEDPP